MTKKERFKGAETTWTTMNDTMPCFESYEAAKVQACIDIEGHQWKYERHSRLKAVVMDRLTQSRVMNEYIYVCKCHGKECPAEVL